MPQGISVHIGLNSVDPKQYEGWDYQFTACEADAKDMQALAKKQKFSSSTLLLTRAATASHWSGTFRGLLWTGSTNDPSLLR